MSGLHCGLIDKSASIRVVSDMNRSIDVLPRPSRIRIVSNMSFTQLHSSFRRRFLLGALACALILAYALYAQFAQGLEPCPLCIFQRIAFAALGLVFLAGAIHAPGTRAVRTGYAVVGGLASLAGIGVAGKHVWVQVFPPAMPSCAPGWDYLVQTNSWLGVMQKVLGAKGDCSNIDWAFLGLSMPAWSLLCFVALGAWVVHGALRRDPAGGR